MGVVRWVITLAFLTSAIGGHQGLRPCPVGWTQVKKKCYKFVDESVSRTEAARICAERFGASLAVIQNMEENNAVRDLLGYTFAWIGLYRQGSHFQWDTGEKLQFENWYGSYHNHYKECTEIYYTGHWSPAYCRSSGPFVCGKVVDCESGWLGNACERQCHCYLGHVCNDTEPCPYGCEPGWHGEMCDKEYQKPNVSFYCMKNRNGNYSLTVSVVLHGHSYKRIGAVNAEGEISPLCTNDRFRKSNHLEMSLDVQIQNVSGVLKTDCPAETVSDRVLQWTWRFQKMEWVESAEDEEYLVQCDLSEADDTYAAEPVVIEAGRERTTTTATQTRVNVRAYLANPESLEPVTNISIGVPVRLVVTLPEGDDSVNPFFYPRTCKAATADGTVSFQMTNSKGCPRNEDEIFLGRMDLAAEVIQSEMFPMFRLRGHTEVVFSCTLEVPSVAHVEYQKPICT
ncbi:uncharacterized protein [Haliotis asinina]|uniref:uncharacterized protein n=1 Tax=Haliotis asinina TaxID=109174 RepID=UPI003531B472